MKILPRHIIPMILLALLMVPEDALSSRPVELEKLSFPSRILGRDVNYSVIVPEGKPGQRFPVMYLLHGIGGDCTSWLEYTDVAGMMERGEMEEMVVVMPDGYLSYYSDAADGSMPYESFFTGELMPAVEKEYPVIADRDHRYIGGFSMGGFGALSLGLRNRDLFSCIVALSPSMRSDRVYAAEGPQDEWERQWGRTFGGTGLTGMDRITRYYRDRSPLHIADTIPIEELNKMHIILDIGDREDSLAESADMLHCILQRRGADHIYRVRDGGHDFDCWNPAFLDAMDDIETIRGHKVSPRCADASFKVKELASGRLYLPASAERSDRGYPVAYVRGDFSTAQMDSLASRAFHLSTIGEIRPMILCFIDEYSDIAAIEAAVPQIRATRRFRTLAEVKRSPELLMQSLGNESMFTAIAILDPLSGSIDPDSVADKLNKHSRRVRIRIDNHPDWENFGWGSRLHCLLRESGTGHQYRVCAAEPGLNLPQWEEWLRFFDSRIHI